MNMVGRLLTFVLAYVVTMNMFAFGQAKPIDSLDNSFLNWHNKDYTLDGIVGTSVDKVYNDLIKDRKPKKSILVAVIDSGVEIDHEDLQGNIWVNEDEIPGNGIDDDHNGYIDDIHGWNFIGNKEGENVNYETLEYTRVYRKYKPKFENVNSAVSLQDNEAKEYADFLHAADLYQKELEKQQKQKANIDKFTFIFYKAQEIIKEGTGITPNTLQDLEKVKSNDPKVQGARQFLEERYEMGFTEDDLIAFRDYTNLFLEKHLNLDFNPRKIIGDNPEDFTDRDYGNNDVVGERADHGTSVSGVIAATRNNKIGIDGIAPVKIMVIRTVPHGDEYDKDVALAIEYAVNNGADIINMSFGKDMSPQKEFVDEAVRLAEEKGVLLIHGSGNDGANIDVQPNFPTDIYLDGTKAQNWITVGASSSKLDADLAGSFSNYGVESVDIFAPGVQILSLDTGNMYGIHDGTSLAAPIVTGIAALVWSYYPELSVQELKGVLLNSATRINKPKVFLPSESEAERKKVKFKTLASSGGIVNAYNAFVEAEKLVAQSQ